MQLFIGEDWCIKIVETLHLISRKEGIYSCTNCKKEISYEENLRCKHEATFI